VGRGGGGGGGSALCKVYRINEKITGKPMEVDSTPKYKTTVLNIGLLKLDSRVATS